MLYRKHFYKVFICDESQKSPLGSNVQNIGLGQILKSLFGSNIKDLICAESKQYLFR